MPNDAATCTTGLHFLTIAEGGSLIGRRQLSPVALTGPISTGGPGAGLGAQRGSRETRTARSAAVELASAIQSRSCQVVEKLLRAVEIAILTERVRHEFSCSR